jgi:hypothetical protein
MTVQTGERLVVPLLINFAIGGGMVLIFSFFRLRAPWCYVPRMDPEKRKGNASFEPIAPRKPSPSLWGWVMDTLRVTDQEVFDTAGLDALMLQKFYRTATLFFGIATILSIGLLLPINFYGDNIQFDNSANSTNATGDQLDLLTMTNIKKKSSFLWAHWVVLFLLTGLFMRLMYIDLLSYASYRHQFLRIAFKQGLLNTLMIRDIPNRYSSNTTTWRDFCQKLYPESFIHAELVKDSKDIDKLATKRETLQQKLERANWDLDHAAPPKGQGAPKRPQHRPKLCGKEKVDSIDFYTKELAETNEKLLADGKKYDEEKPWRAGFLTLSSPLHVVASSRIPLTTRPQAFVTEMAPEWRDVFWPNLKVQWYERTVREFVIAGVTVLLVCFYAIPLGAIAISIPLINEHLNLPKAVAGFVGGYLPTLVIPIFLALLPMVCNFLSTQEGLPANSRIALGTMSKYYYFQIFNVFLVLILASSLFDIIDEVNQGPGHIFTLLGQRVPAVSTTFINYMLLKGVSGHGIQSARLGPLIVGWIKKKFLAKTEQEIAAAENPGPFDYASTVPGDLLMWTIGAAYAGISSLLPPFAFVYFSTGFLVNRYQLLYVNVGTFESAGSFTAFVFTRAVVGLCIGQFSMAAMFGLKEAPIQAALALVLIAVTIFYYYWIVGPVFDRAANLPIEALQTEDLAPARRVPPLNERYIPKGMRTMAEVNEECEDSQTRFILPPKQQPDSAIEMEGSAIEMDDLEERKEDVRLHRPPNSSASPSINTINTTVNSTIPTRTGRRSEAKSSDKLPPSPHNHTSTASSTNRQLPTLTNLNDERARRDGWGGDEERRQEERRIEVAAERARDEGRDGGRDGRDGGRDGGRRGRNEAEAKQQEHDEAADGAE